MKPDRLNREIFKADQNEKGSEEAELRDENLFLGIFLYKCIDLGLLIKQDMGKTEIGKKSPTELLLDKAKLILRTANDSHSKLIRGEVEAGNFDRAADMIIRIIYPNADDYSQKIA